MSDLWFGFIMGLFLMSSWAVIATVAAWRRAKPGETPGQMCPTAGGATGYSHIATAELDALLRTEVYLVAALGIADEALADYRQRPPGAWGRANVLLDALVQVRHRLAQGVGTDVPGALSAEGPTPDGGTGGGVMLTGASSPANPDAMRHVVVSRDDLSDRWYPR